MNKKLQIEMLNGEVIDNVKDLWKTIADQGPKKRINYNKAISVEDALILMKWVEVLPEMIETQILIDDIMTCVIRGISVELAEKLRGYIG